MKNDWSFFERFANFANDNAGVIDWKRFIKTIAEVHKGWFSPKELCSMKAIKLYKTYVSFDNDTDDEEKILKGISNSIEYIANTLEDKHLECFDDLFVNDEIVPTVLKGLSSGKINFYFLAMCPNIKLKLTTFPTDLVESFAIEFLNKYDVTKAIINKSGKLLKIQNNFDKLISKARERINKIRIEKQQRRNQDDLAGILDQLHL